MTPRVSYILVTKNRPEQAENFIPNLRELKTPDSEVIVVDATDPPYSAKIFDGLADVIVTGPDTGDAHGFNRGVMVASGEFIKPLNDDDYYVPEGVHQAIDIMDKSGVDAMQCGGRRWFDESTWGGKGAPGGNQYDCLPEGSEFGLDPRDVLRYGATGVGHFFRRSAFSLIGLGDTQSAFWDLEIMLRAIARGANVKYCRLYTYEHPITAQSSLGNKEKMEACQRDLQALSAKYRYIRNVRELELLGETKWPSREAAPYDGGFS